MKISVEDVGAADALPLAQIPEDNPPVEEPTPVQKEPVLPAAEPTPPPFAKDVSFDSPEILGETQDTDAPVTPPTTAPKQQVKHHQTHFHNSLVHFHP